MRAFHVTISAQSGGNAAFFVPRWVLNAERLTCLNARFFYTLKGKIAAMFRRRENSEDWGLGDRLGTRGKYKEN